MKKLAEILEDRRVLEAESVPLAALCDFLAGYVGCPGSLGMDYTEEENRREWETFLRMKFTGGGADDFAADGGRVQGAFEEPAGQSR